MTKLLSTVLVAAGVLLPGVAHADENIFAYSYGAETLPKGGSEAYLWATDRRGKGTGDYNAQDYKFELEHGWTDKFQSSVYMNFLSVHSDGLEPVIEDRSRTFAWNGMQVSAKYALLNPYTDGVGIAVYVEPGFARYSGNDGEREDKRSLEGKVLLEKHFAEDKLVAVLNLTGEQEWEREPGDDEWEKEFEFETSAGLGYRVAPQWHLGVEGRYSSVYADGEREKWAMFVGPTVHFATKKWWGTLSYQHQVDGNGGVLSSTRNLDSFTSREIRLKLGFNF